MPSYKRHCPWKENNSYPQPSTKRRKLNWPEREFTNQQLLKFSLNYPKNVRYGKFKQDIYYKIYFKRKTQSLLQHIVAKVPNALLKEFTIPAFVTYFKQNYQQYYLRLQSETCQRLKKCFYPEYEEETITNDFQAHLQRAMHFLLRDTKKMKYSEPNKRWYIKKHSSKCTSYSSILPRISKMTIKQIKLERNESETLIEKSILQCKSEIPAAIANIIAKYTPSIKKCHTCDFYIFRSEHIETQYLEMNDTLRYICKKCQTNYCCEIERKRILLQHI